MAKIVMYTTKTCPFCKMQIEYLKSHNIDFEEVLVDENPNAAPKMVAMSGQLGVPFTVISKEGEEDVRILGFDKKRLDEILGF
ncbi:MAG: Glutaredoxin [Candidatus Curtissbacteria bacterium GW2011_GWA1_40_9]|uniref:Glutaredoxin n=1 Tax=Candidatus Curtissbacteria bacterium GW2011_GWA1_40_9 TaxID=1618408 RepID=A0A0G0TTF1_9BACT|nr:MAG: Glutaredoxin [Candidatus Curtissbacteria bacterium GW2011_GWA1_40_9]